ncbi:unnamed protein product [Leptosia nina]|uniref:Uncharacterized protein n=1 Tax=Leptosia nina TaxID=320188 RepID=A0AAV1K402_9NEOP
MSSGENDDSLKHNVGVDNEVIKCLNDKCVKWNEIPSCSSDVNNRNVLSSSGVIDCSDFIVINVTCDVDKPERTVGTNVYSVDCDNSSILSVDSSTHLVPVANNELVQSDSQKLVSLSLSILLAAILQAVRCFAQFIEDIVTPHQL